jgi:chorismate lyase/3-hydroxybenzoate synthase
MERTTEITIGASRMRALDIQLGKLPNQPSAKHNLLLGFDFGADARKTTHPATINLRLQPLEQDQVLEYWWYAGQVNYSKFGSVRIAECDDYAVAIIEKPPTSADNFSEQTREAYCRLLTAIHSTQHAKLVKVWNYFGGINVGNGDSEKYRQFSIGRAQAFEDMGIGNDNAPTGTAIGTQGNSGLVLIALASNRRFQAVENPRQVSAYKYPRMYGPSSPKFSRGGFVSLANHKLYLISGTASVVGHNSNFPYDASLQTVETKKNLLSLCEAITARSVEKIKFSLDGESVLRVYVKNPDDYPDIARELADEAVLNHRNVIFLHGTICRKELMVEIDGVKAV